MKLVKPSYQILEQKPGLEGIYEQIELAGRTCYKSERKEGNTAKDFVDRMIKSGHGAMLEHGTVYLSIPKFNDIVATSPFTTPFDDNPYSKVIKREDIAYITTNYRVIIQNCLEEWMRYLCEPTEHHEKRVTVRFTTDIGVSRELNRHRVDSIAEQSTRYCNFSKDKFDNELSVVLPEELSDPEIKLWLEDCSEDRLRELAIELLDANITWGVLQNWLFANLACEYAYMNLIRMGWKPQQARRILPLDLCTELVHTAFVSDWKHLCELRTSTIAKTGKPHPDMSVLIDSLYREFLEREYIK